ncbi:MSCRAMM family adhesin SdrC [Sphingomonas sp. LaA6.9]|uniref:MSCRAMM family adhesin SdrC n=1 Tax=Sphingomonas sp. LaA6.9 TaxID=2919914 RepID=UPI001F4FC73B|nr:MSCRAMM family adhesin SdrC [Sphingomonas sp. LaA6.9]MCJ8158049.1 MSCRAMM family adhesin SdrC [Sphingomonas sp. LaA6.9]
MHMRHLLTASVLAVGMAITAPAFAQDGGGSSSNNDGNTATDSVVGSEGVINDSFQDSSTNTSTKTYSSADQDNDTYTKTYNSADQDNDTKTYSSADQDNDTYSKTITKTDTETVTVTKDNNNQDNDVKDSYNQDNDNKNSFNQDNDTKTYTSADQDNDTWTYSGNVEIVAEQDMKAVVYNGGDLNFDSAFVAGSNSVSDNAFAAYAGILNQSWNTGVNANVQSATNVAAQGSITFTSGSSSNAQANPVTTTFTVTPPAGGGGGE